MKKYYKVVLYYIVETLTRVHTEGNSYNSLSGFYSIKNLVLASTANGTLIKIHGSVRCPMFLQMQMQS
jgi:hypothetical protein